MQHAWMMSVVLVGAAGAAVAITLADSAAGGGPTGPPVMSDAGAPAPAGAECIYLNFNPLDDAGALPGQEDVTRGFRGEAADDFTLAGDSTTCCFLYQVRFAVEFFDVPAGAVADPFLCWTGVNVVIYEDAAAHCGPGFVTGPAGEPTDGGGPNIEYCLDGVICEMFVTIDEIVEAVPLELNCRDDSAHWSVLISLLGHVCGTLTGDHKYWIGLAPQMATADCGRTRMLLSANEPAGEPALVHFNLLGLDWEPLGGNGDACPPDTPPAGTHYDLSVDVLGITVADDDFCRWDLNADLVVDAADLATLLGAWQNPYGPGELAQLLGSWGCESGPPGCG